MDGNGRWAKKRFLPRIAGHTKGTEAAEKIVKYAIQYEIKVLTLFTFSTENWQRPEEEVGGLLDLFEESVVKSRDSLLKNNIVIRFVGDKTTFAKNLQRKLNELETSSAKNSGLNLNIALNYGGRSEIVRAVSAVYKKKGRLISEAEITKHLDTAGLPDVDLLIRTGGESRVSNFLLWQIAYAELFLPMFYGQIFQKNISLRPYVGFKKRIESLGH